VSRATDPADKATHAAHELRALIRTTHEAAQDLRAAAREARVLVDAYAHDQVQHVMDDYTAKAQVLADGFFQEMKADIESTRAKVTEIMAHIAMTHLTIITHLNEIAALTFDPPTTPPEVRRDAIIGLGRALEKAYEHAGVDYAQVLAQLELRGVTARAEATTSRSEPRTR
jgi:hypothetical protein